MHIINLVFCYHRRLEYEFTRTINYGIGEWNINLIRKYFSIISVFGF